MNNKRKIQLMWIILEVIGLIQLLVLMHDLIVDTINTNPTLPPRSYIILLVVWTRMLYLQFKGAQNEVMK